MSWTDARNVLCVRLDTLGDVLMTTPAIRAVKEGRPDRRVTLLTSTPGAHVGRLVPEIDDVLVYDAPWLETAARRDSSPDLAFVAALHERHFDAAVIFTVYSQSPLPAAMLTMLADVPLRLAHCREHPYQLLTDWVRETEPAKGIRHEVRRQLDLVASVDLRPSHERLSLRPTFEDETHAAVELRRRGLGPKAWLAVHPGASASSRRYPPELFARVVRSLVRDHGVEVLFTGAADEADLIAGIRAEAGVRTHSLAGRLSLGALAAVLARAPVLISNTTGPAHIAAAMGTSVVDVQALTNPQHTPWAVESRRGVPPREVVEAALELLHASGSQRCAHPASLEA